MDDDGDIQLIEFDEDVITLDLPEEKVQNWKIKGLSRSKI